MSIVRELQIPGGFWGVASGTKSAEVRGCSSLLLS